MMSTLMSLRREVIRDGRDDGKEEEDVILQASVIEDWLDSLDNGLYARVQEVYSEELEQGSTLVDIQKVLVEEVEGNLKVGSLSKLPSGQQSVRFWRVPLQRN